MIVALVMSHALESPAHNDVVDLLITSLAVQLMPENVPTAERMYREAISAPGL